MMLFSAALIASQLGGCPKPIRHAHHAKPVAMCTCTPEPRTVILPPAETPLDPIELSVVRYYQLLTLDVPSEDLMPFVAAPELTIYGSGHYWPPVRQAHAAPEIDSESAASSISLLAGLLIVITQRKHS